MDTGEGKFERFTVPEADNTDMEDYFNKLEKKIDELKTKYPKAKGIFTVGEELEIRGSRFLVKDISPFGIKLKLLPAADKEETKNGNDVDY